MNLTEMRRIADARTKGEWSTRFGYQGGTSEVNPVGLGPKCSYDAQGESQAEKDAAFIAMASNQWDKLMAVVEAAKNALPYIDTGMTKIYFKLDVALEALEGDVP